MIHQRKLFSVKSTATGEILMRIDSNTGGKSPAFFTAKSNAKVFRDAQNAEHGAGYCHVSKGPGHRHYSGK